MSWLRIGEKLSTINFYQGPAIGDWALILIIGLLMIATIIIVWRLEKKNSQQITIAKIILIVSLFWLPGYLFFVTNNFLDWQNMMMSKQYEHGERQKFFCYLDDNQKLGGALCNTETLSQLALSVIPASSKVYFATQNFPRYYFQYDFAGAYEVVNNLERTDYAIIFFPSEKLLFQGGQLFINDDQGQEKSLGKFEVVASFNEQIMIIKKIK